MPSKYPRQISLDEKTKLRLASYLQDELTRHYTERGDLITQIQNWQLDYWAEPSTAIGTFPFKNSSTLTIPLAAITVEAIHSRTMTTLFALSQFVSAKPQSDKWQAHARPVEKFLDSELLKRIGIYSPINSAILELNKFGTGVAKDGYEKVTKRAVREVGDKEEEFEVTVKCGATVDAIPLSRFLMPFVYQDPQTAAWCGEEHEFTPYQVRQFELNGKFKEGTMKELESHFTINPWGGATGNSGIDTQKTQEELEKREAIWPNTVKVQEIWLSFDIDGTEDSVVAGLLPPEEMENDFDKEIVVFFHQDSGTFLSCRYNWTEDLRRPYHYGPYFPVEHRWAGLGICKQVEQFQAEITTQHRQRIDNATLANCRMFVVDKLSDYGPDEPVFPGKIWFVDKKDDVQSLQMGEIYSSSYSNENQALLYAQQRTGVNEVNLGMPQQGTPGTATSDLARIQEGNKKFDFTYKNSKKFANSIVNGTILNIKQFGPHAETYYETVEGGDLVKEFFAQDYQMIKHGMLLEIEVAGQQDNKLLDRSNWQQVAQLLTGYYDSMVALAGAKQDPKLLALIVDSGLQAGTEAMKQILESFDLKNINRMIIEEFLNGKLGTNLTGSTVPGQPQIASPPAPVGGNGTAVPQPSGNGAYQS